MVGSAIAYCVEGFVIRNGNNCPIKISVPQSGDCIRLSITEGVDNKAKLTLFGPTHQPKPGYWEGNGWSLVIKFVLGYDNNPIVQFKASEGSDPFPQNEPDGVNRSWIYLYGEKVVLEVESLVCPKQPKCVNLSAND